MKKILIVIPAFNEDKTIGKVLEEINALGMKFLVIDDGSDDQTLKIAKQKNAILLHNDKNLGFGFSVRRGLLYAKDHGYNTAVTIDADGCHDPIDIESVVVHHYKSRSDLTIGSRFLCKNNFFGDFPETKIYANCFATHLINSIYNTNLTDAASGFRIFDEKLFQLSIKSCDFGFSYEMIALAQRQNYKISESDITVRYNAECLHATNRKEFLNLLDTIMSFADGNKHVIIKNSIRTLRTKISNLETARIFYQNKEYFLHPIKECDAYIFQKQNEYFNENKDALIF